MGTIFNLEPEFLDSLSSDELQKLSDAKNVIDTAQERYKQWNGDNGVKQHIAEVGARQRAEQQHAEEMKRKFK